jgi:hypothetical protein
LAVTICAVVLFQSGSTRKTANIAQVLCGICIAGQALIVCKKHENNRRAMILVIIIGLTLAILGAIGIPRTN